MKQIKTVFIFTLRDAVKKKPFIISSVVLLLIVTALFAVGAVISRASDSGTEPDPGASQERTYKAYYADDEGVIPDGFEMLTEAIKDTAFEKISAGEIEEKKSIIAENDKVYAVIVTQDEATGLPNLEFIYKSFMNTSGQASVTEVLSSAWSAGILREQGVSEETIALSRLTIPSSVTSAGTINISGYVAGIAVLVLMFFAIIFYGQTVSSSIATEKTSRVMETLVVSARPRYILLGKCLAMGTLGLAQLMTIVVWALICFNVFMPDMSDSVDFSLNGISPVNIILVVLYFILGFALYAMISSVCGATVSKIEDMNTAMLPVSMISIISFYVGYFSYLASPDGIVARVACYIPLTSPFIMPSILLNSAVSAPTVVVSLLLLAASIVIVTFISIRLYEASVLHYGSRLRLKDMKKLLK